jgi:hypothetical protein
MATWKRLTDTNQRKIDVNLDSVAYLQPFEKHTSIHFLGGEASINVTETPDQIHLADPLRHVLSRCHVTPDVAGGVLNQ